MWGSARWSEARWSESGETESIEHIDLGSISIGQGKKRQVDAMAERVAEVGFDLGVQYKCSMDCKVSPIECITLTLLWKILFLFWELSRAHLPIA